MLPTRAYVLISITALDIALGAAEAQLIGNISPAETAGTISPNSLNYSGYNLRPGTSGQYDCPTYYDVPDPYLSTDWTKDDGANPNLTNHIMLCLGNQVGNVTTDFDRVDDARSFTSETLFSQSTQRLGRALTVTELQSIASPRTEFESRNHAKLSFDDSTFIEFYVLARNAENPQITNFYEPTTTNGVHLADYGIYGEKTLRNIVGNTNLTLGLGYSRSDVQGLIEFQPYTTQQVDQYSARLGVQGQVNNTLIMLNAYYDYQSYQSQPFTQDRSFYGAQFLFGAKDAFLAAGNSDKSSQYQFQVGYARDAEWFAGTVTPKNDFYIGVTAYNVARTLGPWVPTSIAFVPTLLTSANSSDTTQSNAQYRNYLTLSWNLRELQSSALSNFGDLWLAVPLRNDVAVQGPTYYDNYRAGLHLYGFTRRPEPGQRYPILSFDFGYDYQNYYNINRRLSLVSGRISAQF